MSVIDTIWRRESGSPLIGRRYKDYIRLEKNDYFEKVNGIRVMNLFGKR